METKYKAAAKFYGTTSIVLMLMVIGLFILYFRAIGKTKVVKHNEKDSYIVVPKKNELIRHIE